MPHVDLNCASSTENQGCGASVCPWLCRLGPRRVATLQSLGSYSIYYNSAASSRLLVYSISPIHCLPATRSMESALRADLTRFCRYSVMSFDSTLYMRIAAGHEGSLSHR
jgi:hypothetical protein